MTAFDYILLVLAAGVLVYQICLFFKSRRNIIIPGKAPNRRAVAILMGALLVLAFIRVQGQPMGYVVLGLVAVVCVLILANGCGLTETGMYGSGAFIRYNQAVYYEVITNPDGSKTFRLSRMTKEGHMKFDPACEDEIHQLMERKGIPTFLSYQQNTARRVSQRMAAQQNRKRKKKK